MKRTILNCPDLKDKLQFPNIQPSRLKTLINHSFTWQHYLCRQALPNPNFNTILYDHTCTDLMHAKNPSQILRPAPSFSPQYFPSPPHNMWIRPPGPNRPSIGPSNIAETSQRSNHPNVQPKRLRPSGSFSFGGSQSQTPPPNQNPEMLHRMRVFEELPKDVVMTLHQGSQIVSMDFNPVHQTLLLVGTSTGEISIWDLSSREKIHHRSFALWNNPPSPSLQAALGRESGFSVRRVVWNSDGFLFGVIYCKNLVHVYKFNGGSELTSHLEIDAHNGGVNDLAFSQPAKQNHIVTCGDDMTIKVWSATTGLMLHIFKGHSAPVYSICPQSKGMFQFVLSASIDGRVKIWTYDKAEPQIEFAAPGSSATSMAYISDGSRLFSCGTSKDGESYLLEWSESNGGVIRCFNGLAKQSVGIVQFDLASNSSVLAAGDEAAVKFWDMNHPEVVVSINADGGLQNEDSSDTNENAVQNTQPSIIIEPSQFHSLRLPDILPGAEVHKLVYTSSGHSIVSLSSNAIHKIWRWQKTESNPSGKRMITFMTPPPIATAFAFHPIDNNIVVIGMDDSSILIYEPRKFELCVWKMDTWEKMSCKYLDLPRDFDSVTAGLLTKTRVEFHCDDVELLVVHPAFLVVYDASKFEKIHQWVPRDSCISCATYSCDGQMIFAGLTNGTVKIFTKTLHLRCEINPKASLTLQSSDAYALSIAGHPTEPSQFAVGLTDGGVHVFEPLESHGQWGIAQQLQNGAIEIPAPNTFSEGSSRLVREGDLHDA
ncbi:hypothetical protein LUZ60_008764 [Juncus effusus]|nr:hypothetical protein LUZ60_008764 [Juncus effusus]